MRYSDSSANLDRTLMALANPVRREVLQMLMKSDARITALADEFPISLNSVSKHVRLLERAALIKRTVSGREHILSFCPAPLSEIQEWIAARQAFWGSRLQAIDDLLEAENDANETMHIEEKERGEER